MARICLPRGTNVSHAPIGSQQIAQPARSSGTRGLILAGRSTTSLLVWWASAGAADRGPELDGSLLSDAGLAQWALLYKRSLAFSQHQDPVELDERMPGAEESAIDDSASGTLAVPDRTTR